MAGGHAQRAHALLSASGAHRWMHCTPSALLESQFPDTTSEAAKEGTLAHELAEGKLKNKFGIDDFTGRKLTFLRKKLQRDPLWNDDMEGFTDDYVQEIYSQSLAFKSKPWIKAEERVDLSKYVPDGFGTADCIMFAAGRLQVCDLKYGKGVPVDADHNPQLMLYALGVYEKYKLLMNIQEVRMTIIQPRLNSVSDFDLTIEELLAFGEEVKAKAAIAVKGEGEYAPDPEVCRFCRAKAQCRARADKNMELAKQAFMLPPLITDQEVGEYLRKGEDVAKWLKDLQEYALSACLGGKDIPGWKAVEGRGTRAWTDQEAAFEAIGAAGYDQELLWEKKPLTLAQVEKVVGKKNFEEIAGAYFEKTPGKPALVQESDKRPAISNITSAEEAFK